MSDIVRRSISGAVYVGVLLASLLLNQYVFAAVFVTLEVLVLKEFYKNSLNLKADTQKYFCSIVAVVAFALAFVAQIADLKYNLLVLIIPLVFSVFIIEMYRKKDNPFLNIAFSLLGLLYIVLPFALMNYISFFTGKFDGKLLLGIFVLTWLYDSSAYVFGVSFGKHRLFERISPKKSWEGFIGGAVVTIGLSYFAPELFKLLSRVDWIIIASIIVVFGTFGDLVESLFKRNVNVKDSGQIMPGHGGLLDRLDSIIFATPIIFTYLYFFVKA